jgi:hypothetical protein
MKTVDIDINPSKGVHIIIQEPDSVDVVKKVIDATKELIESTFPRIEESAESDFGSIFSKTFMDLRNKQKEDSPNCTNDPIEDFSTFGDVKKQTDPGFNLAVLYESKNGHTSVVRINDKGDIETLDPENIPFIIKEYNIFPTEGIARDKYGNTYRLIIQ